MRAQRYPGTLDRAEYFMKISQKYTKMLYKRLETFERAFSRLSCHAHEFYQRCKKWDKSKKNDNV